MRRYLIVCVIFICIASCQKQDDWLNKKSTKSDVQLTTVADFQALMDNDNAMNAGYPAMGLVGADNYYITYSFWQSLFNAQERNGYVWAKDIFETEPSFDWINAYGMVEYANVALEGLSKISPTINEQSSYNSIKGSALFYRAYAFFNVAGLFAKPYSRDSASSDLGIPIRLTSDVNAPSHRSTIKDTYDQILADISQSAVLLPLKATYPTRPSQTAAYALAARVFLSMDMYDSALIYANKALAQQDDLIDFNSLDTSASYPLPDYPNNKEVIFYGVVGSFYILFESHFLVDSEFYKSYGNNDLRRVILFDTTNQNGITFKGYYTRGGYGDKFAGLATNELWLICAECYARLNYPQEATQSLNKFLANRIRAADFAPVNTINGGELLDLILAERRKELPFTGQLRWQDLRRLNKDPRFAITLSRTLNGNIYLLPPNDNRYVYPIPPDEIKLSKLEQNPR